MNLEDLAIYKAIYETKSLNKASQRLGYGQSNMTARLKVIENEFGTTLFVRSHKGVVATPRGHKVYEFAQQTLEQLAMLQNEFKTTCPQLLISELLFNLLVIEKEQFSIEDRQITIKKTSDINEELRNQPYDQVLTFNPVTHQNYRLKRTNSVFACFLKGREVNVKPLPVLINSDKDCPFRKLTIELLGSSVKMIEVDSLENILKLLSKGAAMALLPEYLVADSYVKVKEARYQIEYYEYMAI